MCITPIPSWTTPFTGHGKAKCSFPTSCKQCCPQLHKTGSYTHYHSAEGGGIPLIHSYLFIKIKRKSLQTRPFSCNIIYKSEKKTGVPKHPHFLNPLAKSAVLVYSHHRSRRILARPTVVQSETYNALKINGLQAVLYCSRG